MDIFKMLKLELKHIPLIKKSKSYQPYLQTTSDSIILYSF
jgi:hypothetical protein